MTERKVYRVPRPSDGIVTQQMLDDAAANACPEIEFRDDITDPVVFVESFEVALEITTDPLDSAVAGSPYDYTARAVGDAPITWSLVSGPAEFSIATVVIPATAGEGGPLGVTAQPAQYLGVVSWTPPTPGAYAIVLKAENDTQKAFQAFSVFVE